MSESSRENERHYPPVSTLKVALTSCCPRCGTGKLYDGYLRVAKTCGHCQFEIGKHDSGDGPAFFVMSFVGAIVVVLAIVLEFTVTPPYWLHVVLWPPLTLGGCFFLLRPAKSILIAQQYKHRVLNFGDET